MDKKLEKLKAALELANQDTMSNTEFVAAFAGIAKIFVEMKNANSAQMEKLQAAYKEKADQIESTMGKHSKKIDVEMAQIKREMMKMCENEFARMFKEQADNLNFMRDKMRGEEAKHTSEHSKMMGDMEAMIPKIPEPIEETPEETRDKLESLDGDERLDKSAIKGLEEELKKMSKKGVTMYGGSRGINIYVDGSAKGLTQYVNFIAGTNITLSYTTVGARTDITINGGAGGSLSVLAATGTINDSNVTFTFPSAPTLVVVNGAAYRDTKGVSISGTTATLDSAPGVGGDIYGLGI